MKNDDILDDNLNQKTKLEEPKFPWYGLLLLLVGIIKLAGGRGIFGYISLACGVAFLGLYFYEKKKFDSLP